MLSELRLQAFSVILRQRVTRWFNKFKSGMKNLKHQRRKGRSITKSTPKNRTSSAMHISYLDKEKTINHQSYLVCTSHYDNARPHVHMSLKKYFETSKYSPMQ